MLRISTVKPALRFSGLIICGLLASVFAFAQDNKPAAPPSPKPVSRDPFGSPPWAKKPTAPKPVGPKPQPKIALAKPTPPPPSLVKAPEIQDRVNFYREQKKVFIAEGKMPPKPTTVFLIDEIEVAGIFRTPRGYAAMVQAKPINLSYVIYPGEKLYDGQLVAIDEDHLVFRQHFEWSDSRSEDKIVRKALRQMDEPDPLTEEKKDPGAAAPAATSAPAPAPANPVQPGTTTEQPAAPAEAAPAPVAVPKKKPAASIAGELINSLPGKRGEETTAKPATEFSGAPAPANPAPAAAPAKSGARTPTKSPAAKNKKSKKGN